MLLSKNHTYKHHVYPLADELVGVVVDFELSKTYDNKHRIQTFSRYCGLSNVAQGFISLDQAILPIKIRAGRFDTGSVLFNTFQEFV